LYSRNKKGKNIRMRRKYCSGKGYGLKKEREIKKSGINRGE
jgi:hypothetical protein